MVYTRWDGVEQRHPRTNRRSGGNRRIRNERRADPRDPSQRPERGLRGWFRALTNPRVGVDRRKGSDQRSGKGRRDPFAASQLTDDELSDLLD